jgi:malonyl-CoA O-methyltransferase
VSLVNLKSKINNLKSRITNYQSPITTNEAYDLWASSYPPHAHNPLMRAEQAALLRLLPDVRGLRALDLACGTGRYTNILWERGAAAVVALDFSAEMLAQLAKSPIPNPKFQSAFANRHSQFAVRASMMQLPLTDDSFDVIVSGLAIGHADDLHVWMRECARVLRRGGMLVYSDFHPRAAQVGMTRSFRANDGRAITVPHNIFTLEAQRNAACNAGLTIEALSEVRAGIELTEAFAGSMEFYRKWQGTPLVLVAQCRK